jgi:hypothetical protein
MPSRVARANKTTTFFGQQGAPPVCGPELRERPPLAQSRLMPKPGLLIGPATPGSIGARSSSGAGARASTAPAVLSARAALVRTQLGISAGVGPKQPLAKVVASFKMPLRPRLTLTPIIDSQDLNHSTAHSGRSGMPLRLSHLAFRHPHGTAKRARCNCSSTPGTTLLVPVTHSVHDSYITATGRLLKEMFRHRTPPPPSLTSCNWLGGWGVARGPDSNRQRSINNEQSRVSSCSALMPYR